MGSDDKISRISCNVKVHIRWICMQYSLRQFCLMKLISPSLSILMQSMQSMQSMQFLCKSISHAIWCNELSPLNRINAFIKSHVKISKIFYEIKYFYTYVDLPLKSQLQVIFWSNFVSNSNCNGSPPPPNFCRFSRYFNFQGNINVSKYIIIQELFNWIL